MSKFTGNVINIKNDKDVIINNGAIICESNNNGPTLVDELNTNGGCYENYVITELNANGGVYDDCVIGGAEVYSGIYNDCEFVELNAKGGIYNDCVITGGGKLEGGIYNDCTIYYATYDSDECIFNDCELISCDSKEITKAVEVNDLDI